MVNPVAGRPAPSALGVRPVDADAATPLRVLIENADADTRRALSELCLDRGLDVTACGGPRRLPEGRCPLVTDGACPFVDAADVVLFDLDLDRADEVAVFDALRVRHPTLPIVVEVPTAAARRHARRLAGSTVVPPFDAERLLGTVCAGSSPSLA